MLILQIFYSNLTSNNIKIAKTYLNFDTEKEKRIKENRGKSGVYRLTNKKTGNFYVGSSIDLKIRFLWYYSVNNLRNPKCKMIINKAILKYGYSSFKLEILEYCGKSDTIQREQYYLDLLKPDYNILSTAGSLLGFKHSELTKAGMRLVKTGLRFS
jgi:group I intron endonuclease